MWTKRTPLLLTALIALAAFTADASAQTRSSGTKAVAVTFPTGGSVNTADFYYFLDSGTALNMSLGLDIAMRANQNTVMGTQATIGYRRYRGRSGKAMPYLEPFLGIIINNLSDAGTFLIDAGARLGVEYLVFDQFTLGASVAANLQTDNSFDDIRMFLSTGSITAAFYW